MNWYGGVWPHSKIPAKSSLTQKRFTLAQKSVREHSFQAITHDSARRVSKPGSLSPQDTFQVRILRAQVAQWGSPVSEDKGALAISCEDVARALKAISAHRILVGTR